MARPLTDRAALLRNRRRAWHDPALFLHEIAGDEVKDRLSMVNRTFRDPAVISGFGSFWSRIISDAPHLDDSEVLDLPQSAHDLVVHAMSLHWADDPVGQLIQARRALRPDGLFLAVLPGGRSLHELRSTLAQAESDITGGLSPRVAPMADIRDLGALLQRAGFALPVADNLPLTVSYASPRHLMRDLRAMGEANALADRARRPLRRDVLERACTLYHDAFGTGDGGVRATFELVVLTGWAPDESQQKPLRPGSATMRLADALGATETPMKD